LINSSLVSTAKIIIVTPLCYHIVLFTMRETAALILSQCIRETVGNSTVLGWGAVTLGL